MMLTGFHRRYTQQSIGNPEYKWGRDSPDYLKILTPGGKTYDICNMQEIFTES